ncbi:MAG TPA: (5-formylfuran-3-yl)methyl phosphate synthase [Fimbriiglobus sp.]|jgi:hypothetical protein
MKTKSKGHGAGLLVSVRSAGEATAAVKSGADLIDVKDPARGSLGMAEAEVVGGVLAAVGAKVPVSAALGEWSPNAANEAVWHLELPLTYVKWGLAGYAAHPGWGEDILDTRRQVPARIQVVAVAYADHAKAKSIPPAEIAKFAKRYRFPAFLLDTFHKDGKTLLDHMSASEVVEIVQSLKKGGVKVAVGGSVKLEQLKHILPAGPDWVAVRGAVCVGGKRDGDLDPVRVKKWKEALAN